MAKIVRAAGAGGRLSRRYGTAVLLVCLAVGFCGGALSDADSDTQLFLLSYFRFMLAEEVSSHVATTCTAGLDEEGTEQVASYMADWTTERKRTLRAALTAQMGDEARERFGQFVSDFTTAEAQGDLAYLDELSLCLPWSESGPADYAELHRHVVEQALQEDLAAGANARGDRDVGGPQAPRHGPPGAGRVDEAERAR